MKIKTKLRLISGIMLVVAIVFVFCALACPTLGKTIYIGDYAIVMVALFGASFVIKGKEG